MRICWWPSAERSDLGFLLCAQRGGNHRGWVLRHIGFWLCQMTEINCRSVKHQCFVRGMESSKTQQEHFQCMVRVQSLSLSFLKALGMSGSFWCWLNYAAFFQGKVLPCSPSQSPEGRFGCDGEGTSLDLCRASSLRCTGKHPAASLFITFLEAVPGHCQVLNKNTLSVLADLWLVLYS